jgi:hypothetical protein
MLKVNNSCLAKNEALRFRNAHAMADILSRKIIFKYLLPYFITAKM